MQDIKIYVAGSVKNEFGTIDNIREKFYVDQEHHGDNIDNLNAWYCEMTALYHLLHNTTEPVIGLEHYRTQIYEDDGQKIMPEETIHKLLEDCDIIAGIWDYEKAKHGVSLKKNLNLWLNGELRLLYNAIKAIHPEFMPYVEDFIKPLGGYHIACNIFIARREIIQEYWDYIWPILQEYERVSPLTSQNLRREGYVYEFLFGAWIRMRKLRLRKAKVIKRTRDLKGIQGQTEIF